MVSKNSEAQKCANTLSLLSNKTGKEFIDMNIVAKSDFNFHGISLVPVGNVTGIWLTSADVAKALGYKSTKSISNLFAQYEDEFSQGMTMVIESVTNGINGSTRRMKVRVFSLRGAHLIAMFARTPVAKEFRRWVLDILDREVAENENASPVARHFNCRVLYSFDGNGTVISAQQARDDEFLTSPKMFAERLRKKGYSLVKMEDFTSISLS